MDVDFARVSITVSIHCVVFALRSKQFCSARCWMAHVTVCRVRLLRFDELSSFLTNLS